LLYRETVGYLPGAFMGNRFNEVNKVIESNCAYQSDDSMKDGFATGAR
jgi:hypothetical protein